MIKEGYAVAEGMDLPHCSHCKSFFNNHCHEKALCIYGANRTDPTASDMFKSSDRHIYKVKPVFSKIWRS